MIEQFNVTIAGSELILHNARLADPLDPIAKAMKEISGKRKKTEQDYADLALLELEGGLYLNTDGECVLPGRMFEASIHAGAKKHREGPLALASVFVDNDPVFTYARGPVPVEELKTDPYFRLTVPVNVQRNKVMRTRPIFRNWSADFVVSLETEIANPDQLRRWIETAGNQCGMGTWRPRYGRNDLLLFEAAQKPLAAVK